MTTQSQNEHPLRFNYKTFDDYLKAIGEAWSIEKPGSELWKNLIVQHIDYLINPGIITKNSYVIEGLLNQFIPALHQNHLWYTDVLTKISILQKDCYTAKNWL